MSQRANIHKLGPVVTLFLSFPTISKVREARVSGTCPSGLSGTGLRKLKNAAISTNCLCVKSREFQLYGLDITLNIPGMGN